ncbi:MAG: DUF4276 family protein [Planctomycetia bacterium]|nr:DUF4276 family protein [Planctomycetia bacterium]
MASPARLVLLVEGQGDRDAVPVLVKKLLTDLSAWQHLFLDPNPMVVGNIADLTCNEGRDWVRYLRIARARQNLGAVLVVQDGDIESIRKERFCSFRFAARLAQWSRDAGGGVQFSVASVFACSEFESWMLACADRLAGVQLPDGRAGIRLGTMPPDGNLETTPRDAKGWLNKRIDGGYKSTRDQQAFTTIMIDHLDAVRSRNLRGFSRLESAVSQIVEAIRNGRHIATPETQP